MTQEANTMAQHETATRDDWLAARKELLEREKELTRRGDEVAKLRQELPWVRLDKEYTFDTDDGTRTLAELFDGRSQLLVYHLMFGPDYSKGACPTCSSMADTFDGVVPHVNNRDVTFLAISRAPLENLQAYKRRMGWQFPWVSSSSSDFNFDFGVSFTREQQQQGNIEYNYRSFDPRPMLETDSGPLVQQAAATGTDVAGYTREAPGTSVFALEGGAVYHTYSAYARGVEFLMQYYPVLDRVPKGRNEAGELWMRRHDEYPAED
jgi:predicted dithiol-disulfide oxidoreductase (DUF899 family)